MASTLFFFFFALTLAASISAGTFNRNTCPSVFTDGRKDDCSVTARSSPRILKDDVRYVDGQLEQGKSFVRDNLWPDGKIPYIITASSLPHKENILAAMKHISCKTGNCVRFVDRTDEEDYLSIFKGDGCASYVGRIGGEQKLSLADGCNSVTTILHELLHAMGFHHEHQRSDRDDFITVHLENVEEGAESQFTKLTDNDGLRSKLYDFRSLMHYDRTEFSKNGLDTMTPKDDMVVWLRICQKDGLSDQDTKTAKSMYCCSLLGLGLYYPPPCLL